jgi:hypothetical protein
MNHKYNICLNIYENKDVKLEKFVDNEYNYKE